MFGGRELGYFSAGIIDYVIHTKTDNLAVTGISRGRTFVLALSNISFSTSQFIGYVTKQNEQ